MESATTIAPVRISGWLARLGLALALAVPVGRLQAADAPAVPFVAGGIGADERDAVAALGSEYKLRLVFTLIEGNYLTGVDVAIKRAAATILQVPATGPFLYVSLAPGVYAVEARYGGTAQTRTVRLGERPRTEYFRWPSNPEMDFPGPKNSEPRF